MAENNIVKHHYSLRNKSNEQVADNSRLIVADRNNRKDYCLNEERAMRKKAAKTKVVAITHEMKAGGNLYIECNTAAYELVKLKIMEITANEMSKLSHTTVKTVKDERPENKGYVVEELHSVQAGNPDYNCKVHLYNTTCTVLINGKGVYSFSEVVVPKLYELIKDSEQQVSTVNKQIFETLQPKSSKSQNKPTNIGEESTVKNENGDMSLKKQDDNKIDNVECSKIQSQKEDQSIIDQIIDEPKITEKSLLNKEQIAESKNCDTNTPKTCLTQLQKKKLEIKEYEDIPLPIENKKQTEDLHKLDDDCQNIETNVIQEKTEDRANNEVPITPKSIIDAQENTSLEKTDLLSNKVEVEIDFQTSNPQDTEAVENDCKQKGTKRLRVEDDEDEDDDLDGKDRVDKKERRGAEKEIEEEKEVDQPMNIDVNIEKNLVDHDYTNGKETLTEQEFVEQQKSGTENELPQNNQCQKCKKNVASRATQCGKCKEWIHYNCLRISEKQLQEEWPGDYICKSCDHEQKEMNNKEMKTQEAKNEVPQTFIVKDTLSKKEQNKKEPLTPQLMCNEILSKQQTKIIITDEIEPNERRITELEEENENIKNKLKELTNKCKEYKKDIQLRDNQLNDRKIEVTRVYKTNEDIRKEINTTKLTLEIVQKQKEMLESKLQQEKSDWNDDLSKELQKQYEIHENQKSKLIEERDKWLQQYTGMIEEKNQEISKWKKESDEVKSELTRINVYLKQAENSSKIIEEKNTIINKFESDCLQLRKQNENLINVNAQLEHEIYQIKATEMGWEVGVREDDNTNYNQTTQKKDIPTRVESSKLPLAKESKEKRQQDLPSTARGPILPGSSNDTTSNSTHSMKSQINNNYRESTNKNTNQNGKQCYSCGDYNHEIKNCHKKSNLFVKFTGDHWINNYKLDQVFGKLGNVTYLGE